MKARVVWKSRAEGGRVRPPVGDKDPFYSTILAFTDTELSWPESVIPWSLFVIKLSEESSDRCWLADVGFVVDNAPHHLLQEHRTFDLYEGKKCVASGELL